MLDRLSKARKHREISTTLATTEQLDNFVATQSNNLHSGAAPTCLDINPRNPSILITGGTDKNAVVFDLESQKEVCMCVGVCCKEIFANTRCLYRWRSSREVIRRLLHRFSFTLARTLCSPLRKIRRHVSGLLRRRVSRVDGYFMALVEKAGLVVGGYRKKSWLKAHTASVVGCSIHATGDYLATASVRARAVREEYAYHLTCLRYLLG